MAESLKLIKSNLNKAVALFPFPITQDSTAAARYTISDLAKFREFVGLLAGLNILQEQVLFLSNSIIFATAGNSINVQANEALVIRDVLDTLKVLIANFMILLDEVVPDEQVASIDIKLPNSINDFNKLSKIAHQIDLAISQPLAHSDVDSITNIESVENGSIILNVDFSAQSALEAVGFIGAFIRFAIYIRKSSLENDLLVEKIREKKIKNSKIDISELEKTNKEEEKERIEEVVNEIFDKYYTRVPENGKLDELGRITNSLDTLIELFSKGVVITPSINATSQITKEFPTVSEIQLLENKTKESEGPQPPEHPVV